MDKNLHNEEVMKHLEAFSIPWEKSKEDVWAEMQMGIKPNATKVVSIAGRGWFRAVAAVMVLLLSTGLFMRFFERNLSSAYGEHISHQLPDGSVVELNSESSLSYHPLWWKINRNINFEGEGFFMVQKGKKFTVKSGLAETQVLGTSFSIFSRKEDYRVTCHTGRVQVLALSSSESSVLNPNQGVQLEADGSLKMTVKEVLPDPMPWKTLLFEFTGTPLKDVLDEIQRQYGVVVNYPESINHFYTGEIDANRDLVTTLNLVCKAFKITFEKTSKGEYQIIESTGKED